MNRVRNKSLSIVTGVLLLCLGLVNLAAAKIPHTIPITLETAILDDGQCEMSLTEDHAKQLVGVHNEGANELDGEKYGFAALLLADIDEDAAWNDLTVHLSSGALDTLRDANAMYLSIKCPRFIFTLNASGLEALGRQDAILTFTPVSPLGETKASTDDRPGWNVDVMDEDGEALALPDRAYALKLRYAPAEDEHSGALYAVTLEGENPAYQLRSSFKETVVLGEYSGQPTMAVGYKEGPRYPDTEGHRYEEDLVYAISRGLIDSFPYSDDGAFAPDRPLDRATLVTALARLAEADLSRYSYTAYTDIEPGRPYAAAAEWARNEKILPYANGTFGADKPLTREDLAVSLDRFAAAEGRSLPAARLSFVYEDANSIGKDARKAVSAVQAAGIIGPYDGNTFSPKEIVSRGEACSILRSYIEVTMDESMGRGWADLASGNMQYYDSLGKAMTGWRIAEDTGAPYYFDENGLMQTGWVEDNGHTYYLRADGVLVRDRELEIDGKSYAFDENGMLLNADDAKVDAETTPDDTK